MSKRVLFICNESVTVVNFRRELIKYLIQNDYMVDVLCADDKRIEEIKQTGVNNIYVVPFTNRSINPFAIARLKRAFAKVIKQVNPDIVFTFETKPNIIGASAAYKCGIKTISMVEGVGNPFQPTNFKGKILRTIVTHLYRKALKHNDLVIFLNEDDKQEFISRRIVKEDQTLIIPGIGVDTNSIAFNDNDHREKKVVMLSRLTTNKGIEDFCKIAEQVRKQRPDISFKLYGEEQSVRVKDIIRYIEFDYIKYCGYTNNPIQTISEASIYISTSCYREGFPRTFLEAMAVGTPIIATDTVGSRDAIKDGVNGYMLHMHDIDAFTKKILELIDDQKELKRISKSARKYCEDHYQSDIINAIILKHLNALNN